MLRLEEVLQAWGTPDFDAVLKRELVWHASRLPLQQALRQSSSVADSPIAVMVLKAADSGGEIAVKVAVMFEGRTDGCACADDPSTDNKNSEYCEILLRIDKTSAIASTALVAAPD
jgi:hypothetical protein